MTTHPASPWRVGRSLGRTLYVGDVVIGMVDSPELASVIAHAVNTWRAAGPSHAHLWQRESSFGEDWDRCPGCGLMAEIDTSRSGSSAAGGTP